MTAKDFILENYPVTAKDFENKECAGLYDIVYICEKYHESKVKNLGLFSISQQREQLAILALERISKAHSESFSAGVASEALYKIANCG